MSELTPEKLTYIHARMEDMLIEFRDLGIGTIGPNNGMVVKYRDGTPSDIIRLGTRDAVQSILRYAEEYDADPPDMDEWLARRRSRIEAEAAKS